jgi:ATP-dependent Clp protease protease subunit
MSDDKKFMNDKQIGDVTPELLIREYLNNTSELKSLDDISEAYDTIDRSLFIGPITNEVGDAIEHIIRIYNIMDKDIPVEERKPIKLFINSGGGVISAGYEIIDAIRLSKTPVYTINICWAASAALEIFMVGHKRFCYPNATFLFHEGAVKTDWIDAGKFRDFNNFHERSLDKSKQLYFTYTKMTPELYKEKRNDDWFFFADEAIEYGFCDEILEEFI